MKTKRVNDEFHRLDVKLPVNVYAQISEIAVNNFGAKIHHISGKPEITSTLIYLLQLGIESFSNGNELLKKPNTDNLTDTIPITNDWVKELIKDELIPVQSKLDELSEMVYRLTYTDNKPIMIDNVNSKMDTNQLNLLDYFDSQNEDAIGNDEVMDTEKPVTLTQSEVESLPSENELESIENDKGTITPEIENKEVKDDSERADSYKIPEEIKEKIKKVAIGEKFDTARLCELIEKKKDHLTKFYESHYAVYFSKEVIKGRGNPCLYTRK